MNRTQYDAAHNAAFLLILFAFVAVTLLWTL
jgi:hypothetical protein